MKKILFSSFLILTISISNIFFYPSNVKADTAGDLEACNMAIDRLNTLGFSYQRFPQNTKPINFGAVTCGTSEGTNDMIMILVNPLRLQVTAPKLIGFVF
jgi:hypothetical protein